ALTLSRRQSEVLVLLGASTSGLSGEQLAIALYGDEGNPLSARAEVSRLRRAVGKSILAEPYRLQAGVDCDIGQLRLLLCDGRTAAALDAYRGPLLPRSDAPGVVALRSEIDDWVRRAVLTSDDLEVLWRWLSTPSGEGDVQAWRRFLANVSADDGRRVSRRPGSSACATARVCTARRITGWSRPQASSLCAAIAASCNATAMPPSLQVALKRSPNRATPVEGVVSV
ncbi:MAG TPA: hypothetical protein VFY45_15210, partial [Baekduia sp.]|nr:hypothetical protein [Baekduia sp.]